MAWLGILFVGFELAASAALTPIALAGLVVLGLVALAPAPRVVRLLARWSRWLVDRLLGPGAGERIHQLEGQRSSAVRSADVDRRGIEQDLHDGAQVRLTDLAMQIGLAREALAEGAEHDRVTALVEEAHGQAKLALREIRDLARGIHPAILTDRGLDAALASMVGRLPVPVELEVDVAARPAPALESIAYFVAAALGRMAREIYPVLTAPGRTCIR